MYNWIAKESSSSRQPTKRAVDGGESARFTSIFLASDFSCSQALSQPAPPPLTPTVGRLVSKIKEKEQCHQA
jgi:hypothetical protein